MLNPSRLMQRIDARSDALLVAIGSVVAALAIKLAFGPIADDAPLLLFFGAVIVSAWLGGFRAGALATVLSALVVDLQPGPPHWNAEIGLPWALRMMLFVGEGLFISAAAQSALLRTGDAAAPGAWAEAAELEAAQASPNPRPVRISSLVREVLAAVRAQANAKDVSIETVIDHGTGAVEGDHTGLREVVATLITNAVKFTPAGGRVCVRVRRRGNDVELSVVDTGRGIVAQDMEQIFLPGEADAGKLARARRQIHLHGGEMTFYSAGPGTGATFTVLLRRLLFIPTLVAEVEQG
jgi:K+-sensing histidine kinase KdpD